MNEAIERARKRAQAASSRHPGSFTSSSHNHHHRRSPSYQSPLGAGFTFDRNRPESEQINPYSIKGKRQRQEQQQQQQKSHNEEDDDNVTKRNAIDGDDDDDHGDFRILYEESHFNVNGGWSSPSGSSGSGGFGGSVGGYSGMERMRGGKEYVVERMKNRRKYRVRERGEPNPYHVRHNHYGNYNREGVGKNTEKNGAEEGYVASGCSIM